MSANTMTTSDPRAPGVPALEVTEGAGSAPAREVLPAGIALPPDPAVIARLANEFFAALPWASPPAPTGGASSPPAIPQGEQRAGPDASAIPSSPIAAAGAAPSNPAAIPSQGAPGSPATAANGARPPFLNVAPALQAMSDFFSLPAVPVPSEAPSAPASPTQPTEAELRALPMSLGEAIALAPRSAGAEPGSMEPGLPAYFLDARAGTGLNSPPAFPPAGDFFSFPDVPAAPAAPTVPIESPKAATSLPAESELRANATSPAGVKTEVPELSSSGAPSTSSAPSAPVVNANHTEPLAGPFNAVPSLPATGENFNLPGVPGVQGAPGIPALPSSPPTPPTETDARAVTASAPGASTVEPKVAGSAPPAAPATTSTAHDEPLEVRPEVVPDLGVAARPFDPYTIRRDFPVLQEHVHGRPLVWLDNAATTQKPNAVIERLASFYRHENSNVHRAAHALAARATDAYEGAREKVRRFLNASSTREIIFVRGTTEGINLVAKSWGHRNVNKDDEVVITWLEHHANIVPWQQLCAEKDARLRVAPVDDTGQVILDRYERLLGPRTRIVAISHVSNALGTITPVREMIEMAHRHGACVLVDGAQSVAHMREDVQALDCDFFVFSGHKIFGPTGIGVVYGKESILQNTPPWQGGGSMILDVTFEKTIYNVPPARFEAGTGNIADAVGLGAALDYVSEVGLENINRHEHELLRYATAGLATVPGLRIIGTAREKAGVISFVIDEVRVEDIAAALDQEGIAVRAGHHCAQPIVRRFGVEGTVRPSLALYNTHQDIDALVAALLRIQAGRGHRKL